MRKFQFILCPVDFSEFSRLALHYAVAFAREFEAGLMVIHVVPDFLGTTEFPDKMPISKPELMSGFAETLEQFVSENVPPEIQVIQKVEAGTPPGSILKIAGENSADLIVMGTHGRSGFERFLLGSVTNKILNRTKVPVLTVCRPTHHFLKEDELRPIELKRILCPIDPEHDSLHQVEIAISLARFYQSEILFFYVAEKETKEGLYSRKDVFKSIRELIRPEQEDWCKVQYVTSDGRPEEEILRAAQKFEVDLVITGHHTRRSMELGVLGSVAARVVSESVCPVLVVRT